MKTRTVAQWMEEKQMSFAELSERAGLELKTLEAICQGRYTPSPQQRQRVADALSVPLEEVAWGHTNEVANLQGHGPQFGRTP